jgi:hypothetical protein
VNLEEIEKEAIALAEAERNELVCKLLDTLPGSAAEVPDDEVARRDAELENGEVLELSHDEFVRRVKRKRDH